MTDKLWTVREVAEYLGVHVATVYTLPIKWIKIGRARRYDPSEVRLFVGLNAHGRTMARAS